MAIFMACLRPFQMHRIDIGRQAAAAVQINENSETDLNETIARRAEKCQ